jgi:hypothetical protein
VGVANSTLINAAISKLKTTVISVELSIPFVLAKKK